MFVYARQRRTKAPLVGVIYRYFGRKDWMSYLPSGTPVHDHKVPSTIDGSFISRRERTVTNYSGWTVWLGFLLNSPALLPFPIFTRTQHCFPLSKDCVHPFCYFQKHNRCNSPALIRVTGGGLHSKRGAYMQAALPLASLLLQFNVRVKQNKTTFLTLYKGSPLPPSPHKR